LGKLRTHLVAIVSLCGLVVAPPRAQAQRFFAVPPLRTDAAAGQARPGPGNEIGLYASFWEVPTQFQLSRVTGISGVTFESSADTSAMIAGELQVGRQWSAGGWYNSVGGTGTLNTGANTFPTSFHANLLSLHATYYTKRELALQVGVLHERLRATAAGTRHTDSTYSLNAWVLKSFRLIGDKKAAHPLQATVGLGYLGGEGILNELAGVHYRLTDTLSLNAFVWLFDINHPVKRYTVGLSGRF
jgi:hypothetical protein